MEIQFSLVKPGGRNVNHDGYNPLSSNTHNVEPLTGVQCESVPFFHQFILVVMNIDPIRDRFPSTKYQN
jgi:hypothetical protein